MLLRVEIVNVARALVSIANICPKSERFKQRMTYCARWNYQAERQQSSGSVVSFGKTPWFHSSMNFRAYRYEMIVYEQFVFTRHQIFNPCTGRGNG